MKIGFWIESESERSLNSSDRLNRHVGSLNSFWRLFEKLIFIEGLLFGSLPCLYYAHSNLEYSCLSRILDDHYIRRLIIEKPGGVCCFVSMPNNIMYFVKSSVHPFLILPTLEILTQRWINESPKDKGSRIKSVDFTCFSYDIIAS